MEPMGGAHGVFQPAGQKLDNLAISASTDSAILQQLTAANIALTTTNAMLATNKTLVDLATKVWAAANAGEQQWVRAEPQVGVKRFSESQMATVGHMGIRSTAATQIQPVLPEQRDIA